MAIGNLGGRGRKRRRYAGKYVTTRSGRVLKVHRSLGKRWAAMREGKSLRKVKRLRGLPKSRFKRLIWHIDPRHLAEYWFSRDGAITGLKILGVAIVAVFVLTLGVFAYFRKDLPDISVNGKNLGGSISYYDRTGQTLLWQDYDAIKRVPGADTEISQYVKDATVAIEDRDFYKHRGFDIKGIIRAAFNDIFKKGGTQGGSTITQQLVKLNHDWTNQRSIGRKIKEVILAVELERTYKKEEILTGYLNAAPYGGIDYGVQAAASDYFHKSAKDLNLAESAMLAAIPKSRAIYSAYNKDFFVRESFLGRYNYVLDSMVEIGKLSKDKAEEAKKVDILATVQPQQTKYAGIRNPYFLLAAKNELTRKFVPQGGAGSSKIGGWKVITTMDLKLQELAEQQVNKGLVQVKRQGGDTAALAAEDVKTGQMVALVGGVDFTNPEFGQINYAQTLIPPGSSFKPYDYTALIENSTNAGAGSVLYDVDQALPGYPCTNKAHPRQGGNCLKNYDFRQPGPMTLRYALGGSRNIPAVKAILTTGVDKTIKTAEAMGLRSGYKCYANNELTQTTQCYGAAGIGDGAFLRLDEHVSGFATLSRMGQYIPPTYILKIYDAKSETKPFYEYKQPKPEQALRADTAYIVTDMISDPNASYFPGGQKAQRYKGWNFALKTGTTNDAKDGWLIGYSTKYAAAVWVGHHSRQKAMSGFMENMTRPIWTGWMNETHANLKPENWTRPSTVQELPAFVVPPQVGFASVEPSRATDLYPSWYRPRGVTKTQDSTLDKVSNKIATDCTPELAKQKVSGNTNADQFSIDIFYGANAIASGSVTATDDIHNCSDQKPAITLTTTDNKDGTYTLTATATAGSHAFSNASYPQYPGTINFSVDGQVVKSYNDLSDSPSTRSFSYSVTSGSHSVTAQVIDSVLYDAISDTATITYSPPAVAPPGGGGTGGGGGGGVIQSIINR